MLEGKSSDYKTLVLLRIVKRLIENTESYGIHKLENILHKKEPIKIIQPIILTPEDLEKKQKKHILIQKKQIKEEVKNKFKMTPSVIISENTSWASTIEENEVPRPPLMQIKHKNKSTHMNKNIAVARPRREKLQYNDSLPEHLRYLRPTATLKKAMMDVGELNPYLSDPNVDSIEVEGENEKIYVVGRMGKKPITLTLAKEEIEEVIDRFSKESKIPKVEGLFKVSINNLILTAMVSSVISSRFIIKKIKI